MGKFLFAALIFAIGLSSQSVAQANLLTNPSFESASLAGWNVDFNGDNQDVSNANPKDGSINARNWYDGGLYQDVSIIAGQQYRLTGWAYVPSGGSTSGWGSYIGLRFLDGSGTILGHYQTNMQLLTRNQYNMADTIWVTAPATTVTARVRFGTWSGTSVVPASPTDFDNFDLETQVIPEPASLLLLGTGLAGLVGLTRKNKKRSKILLKR